MGHRRKAREYALQGLYMHEISKKDIKEITSLSWVEANIPDDIKTFAASLISGTIEKIPELDSIIEKYSKNWTIERLDSIDKAILRLSIYSLLYIKEVPYAVTINEGIELGKLYGGENSGHFINGILDAVRINHLKEEAVD